jgi:flagellar FliL protein
MAKPSDTQPDAPPQKPAGKKRLLIGAVVAAVLLVVGGGAAWLVFGYKGDPHAAQAKAKARPSAPPMFLTLEPFVVNLAGDVQHFLQVGIDLRVADSSVSEQVKVHLPEIRNAVLLLLSSKKVEDLARVEQKNRLREEIREAVNRPLGIQPPAPKQADAPALDPAQPLSEARAAEPAKAAEPEATPQPDSGVLEVLLTSFVIQ